MTSVFLTGRSRLPTGNMNMKEYEGLWGLNLEKRRLIIFRLFCRIKRKAPQNVWWYRFSIGRYLQMALYQNNTTFWHHERIHRRRRHKLMHFRFAEWLYCTTVVYNSGFIILVSFPSVNVSLYTTKPHYLHTGLHHYHNRQTTALNYTTPLTPHHIACIVLYCTTPYQHCVTQHSIDIQHWTTTQHNTTHQNTSHRMDHHPTP